MWTRFHIKCENCNKVTNLRVQIPEKEKMTIAFDCPECKSKLRGVLNVDFKNHGWKYESERGEQVALGFNDGDYFYEYSDVIVTSPPSKKPHDVVMPTMRFGTKALMRMKTSKDMRKGIPESGWEDLKDFLVAYSNFNKPTMEKLYGKLTGHKENLKYDVEFHMAYFKILNIFVFPWINFENHGEYVLFLSKNIFSYANYKNPKLDEFMVSFSDKICYGLTNEMTNLIDRFIGFRDSLIYVNQEINPFSFVSNDNFNSLKNFYTDCFEFLGRYSHLIFRLQNLIERGDENTLPTGLPRNITSIDDFISADNGSKLDIIKLSAAKELIEIFDNVFDSRLRNGINHFKASMDTTTQIISYYPVTKRPDEEHQISYFDFLKLNIAIFQSVLKIGQLLKFRAVYKQAITKHK